jgi:hypothetical protein
LINHAQARAVAEQFLKERGPLPGWNGVERVLAPEEAIASMSEGSRLSAWIDAIASKQVSRILS